MIAHVLPVALLASLALGTFAAAAQSYGDVVVSPAAITALDDGALAKTYPDKRGGLSFEEGRFSPDGALFAFSVSQIESGDPEQVWLYDLRARKLVPATESPKKSAVGFTISGFAFGKDDTLYVTGERVEWRDQSNNRPLKVAATMAHSTEVKAFPKDADAAFAAQAAGVSEDDDATILHGDRFDLIAQNRGHGVFTLSVKNRKTARLRKIADGSWELQHVLFDGHAKLRFGDSAGIMTVDLDSGTRPKVRRGAKACAGTLARSNARRRPHRLHHVWLVRPR